MPVKVSALDHIVINVSDVARSAQWYQNILGMEIRVFDPGPGKAPRTSLVFGNQKINVRPRDADKVEWFTADHETRRQRRSVLSDLGHAGRGGGASEGTWGGDRGRPGHRNRAPAARCGRSIAGIPTAA